MGGCGSGRQFLQTKDKVGNGYSLDANEFTRWQYTEARVFKHQYAHAHARHGVR